MVDYMVKAYPAAVSTRANNGNLPLHSLCGSPALTFEMVDYVVRAHPAAVSIPASSGLLPFALACETAPLSAIYKLVRTDPRVVIDEDEDD